MSKIVIADLNQESIFTDLSNEQNQQVYGGILTSEGLGVMGLTVLLCTLVCI